MLFSSFFIYIDKKTVLINKKKVIKTPVKLVMQGKYFTSQHLEGEEWGGGGGGGIIIRWKVMYMYIVTEKMRMSQHTHTQTQN